MKKSKTAKAPYDTELRGILDSVLPDVLTPLRRHGTRVPPLRYNQPTATVIAPCAAGAVERPACKTCGRGAEFKETRNGVPRYRTECRVCRNRRREAHPRTSKPIALPHAVRPRCQVPGCPNAIAIVKRPVKGPPRPGSWVPEDSTAIFMGSPWCDKHRRLNDRPVGLLTPPPAYPRHSRSARFKTGLIQWCMWRRRMRRDLGLPRMGTVSAVYTPQGQRVFTVSTTGRGMRVTAWPDLIRVVAWWTCRMPLQKVHMHDDLRDWWPTYGSLATAFGVSPALVAWVVWELRVGRIMVRESPVQRMPCTGQDGSSFTQPVKAILDTTSWTWTDATPADQSACAAVRWQARPMRNPPSYLGTRIPWRYRSRAARREGRKPPPELLPPERRRSTSESRPTATAPSSGTRSESVWRKLNG